MRRPFVLEISFIAHSTGTRPALARRPPQGPPFAATSESTVLRMQTPVNQGESRVGTSKFKGWRLLTIETQSQRGSRPDGRRIPTARSCIELARWMCKVVLGLSSRHSESPASPAAPPCDRRTDRRAVAGSGRPAYPTAIPIARSCIRVAGLYWEVHWRGGCGQFRYY